MHDLTGRKEWLEITRAWFCQAIDMPAFSLAKARAAQEEIWDVPNSGASNVLKIKYSFYYGWEGAGTTLMIHTPAIEVE